MPPASLPRLLTDRLELLLPPAEFAERIVEFYRRNAAHLVPWEPRRGPEFLQADWWRPQLEANIADFYADRSARMVVLRRGDPEERVIGIANLSGISRGAFQACYLGYSIDH